jgi:MarR family transcriptional regulator, organic hydroperoxide resistance regulator
MKHRLQDYIGFRILQVMKVHRVRADAAFGEIGLHPGQEMALYQLWNEEGLTQSELGERLNIDASTVTKTLQRLEQAQVVERHQDTQDGRVYRVYLTPKGRELREQVQKIWDDLEDTTVKGLSDIEKALLLRLLSQIQENFNK